MELHLIDNNIIWIPFLPHFFYVSNQYFYIFLLSQEFDYNFYYINFERILAYNHLKFHISDTREF